MAGRDSIEREVKLGAWPGFRLPDFDGLAAWIHAGETEEHRLVATYYDAPDLRLIRAGVTLRHRTGEAGAPNGRWTAKVPSPEGAPGVLDRFELDHDGPGERPPDRLVGVLRGRLRSGELVPVAQLETVRRSVALRDGGGRRLGEVADDEVSVLEDGRVAARFREVEAEVDRGAPAQLLDLVIDRLRAAGAGKADLTPKLVRALGPRALAPPDPPVPELGGGASVGDVVHLAIANAVQRLQAHDPLVRLDAGPVGVHQARVAMRRLRSDLRTFADLVDPDWVATFADDLKWLAGELGHVRDADVRIERLLGATAKLPEGDAAEAKVVLNRMRRERTHALAELQGVLDGERYLDLLDRLVDAGRSPKLLPEASRPAAKALVELAGGPWRKLRKAVDGLGPEPVDDDLHAIRIKAKRARYAAEAAAVVIPKAAAHAKAIAGLQDVLGEWHDAVVAEEWLREAVRTGTTRSQAMAVGLLIAAQQAEAVERRGAWRDAWAAANAKKVRSWME